MASQNPSVVNGPRVVHTSEARRTLPVQSYKNDGQSIVFDLPLDTAIKRANIRCYGYFSVTYASGSPIADSAGFSGRLLARCDVVAAGGDTVKSIDPYMMQKQQLLLNTIMPRRAYATSASQPTSLRAQTDSSSGAPFVYPATAQFVVINEAFTLYFEHPWIYNAQGGRQTLLYTRGMNSCQLVLQVGAVANLQRAETSPVAVTYGSVSLSFEVQLIENPWVVEDPKDPFLYFREITKHAFFSGETRNGIVDVKTGGMITGFHFLVRNGDVNKSLSDIALTRMRLKANTSNTIADVTFLGQQEENISRYGVDSKLSSGVHSLSGYCYLGLMSNGAVQTALDSSRYSTLVLDMDTASGSVGTDQATYTNSVDVEIMTQDLIRPAGK